MPSVNLWDMDPDRRTREWVLSCIRYEEHQGIHTYHACDCGRGLCRSVQCPACWREVLAQQETVEMKQTYRVLADHWYSPPAVRVLNPDEHPQLTEHQTIEALTVEIDLHKLVRTTGGKAVRNASGKSVVGAVTVRHEKKSEGCRKLDFIRRYRAEQHRKDGDAGFETAKAHAEAHPELWKK